MGNKQSAERDEENANTPIIGLYDHLMREQHNRDPRDFYDTVEILGVGSMGSVSRVKKKDSVLGGSARSSFVNSFRSEKLCFGLLPFSCCFGKQPSSPKKGALVTPVESNGSSENPKRLYKKSSSLITYGHKDVYYALKSIHLDRAANETYREELRNEIRILRTLNHPHILTPIETFEYKNQLSIVLEICTGGDLYTRDPYSEAEAARIVSSILGAVAYMHSKGVVHRDLKYENVMFLNRDPHADVKVIDFGLSKKYASNEVLHDAVGTVYSMSPELLRGDYTSKVDVWSVGVLAFMLLSSSMPFYGRSRKHVMQKIIEGSYSFKSRVWRHISDDAKDFVTQLLQYEPEERPTASDGMQHHWLTSQANQHTPELAKMDVVQAALETFAGYNTLKRLALMVVAYKSTTEEVGFLRKMFKKYDKNLDGDLTLQEFKSSLADYDYTDEEIETMFKAMDIDGSGGVQYAEFLAATIESHGSLDEERLAEAFDRMDADDSGYITVQDLCDILGKNVRKSYVDSIIDEADLTRDHRISYEEFMALWSEDGDIQRQATMERVVNRRMKNGSTPTLSIISPTSSSGDFLEVEVPTSSERSETSDEGITGDFLFQQEKIKSVRNFADI